MGVGSPSIDVFAKSSDSHCPIFWGQGHSAFDQSWKAQGLLWSNPPFSRMGELVSKIEAEGPECLIVCPNWPTSPWWEPLQNLTAKAQFYPTGGRLLETDQGRVGPTKWGVWVMYIPSQETHPVRVVKKGKAEHQLVVPVQPYHDGEAVGPPCKALIDTGGSVSLVQKGLWPERLFRPASRPYTLIAANGKKLEGGSREITVTLRIKGVNKSTNKPVELRIPTTLLEADIADEVLLGFDWCRDRGVSIYPPLHSICVHKGHDVWVEGVRTQTPSDPEMVVQVVGTDNPPRALDLFSGTGSATRVLQKGGFEVTSLDVDPQYHPTICCSILEWDYRQYPPGYFSLIVAAPPTAQNFRGRRPLEAAILNPLSKWCPRPLKSCNISNQSGGGLKPPGMGCCRSKTSWPPYPIGT